MHGPLNVNLILVPTRFLLWKILYKLSTKTRSLIPCNIIYTYNMCRSQGDIQI